MIERLIPQASVVAANIEDSVDDLAGKLRPLPRLFLFHLDLTFSGRIFTFHDELASRLTGKCQLWNYKVRDISKTAVHAFCRESGLPTVSTQAAGDPHELCIVKTNLNFAGRQERRLSDDLRRSSGLGEPTPLIQRAVDYKVLERKKIPLSWWTDSRLVVERYISNRANKILRCYVAGERLVVSEAHDRMKIKKIAFRARRKNYFLFTSCEAVTAPRFIEESRVAATRIASRMGLDYGTVDVVLDDDFHPYVVDVNATPHWGAEKQPAIIDWLRPAFLSATSANALQDVTNPND